MEHIFYKPVNKRSRKAMTEFLSNHFRYWTINSWNRLSSYANHVKIYNLKFPKEIEDKLYQLINDSIDTLTLDISIEEMFLDFFNKTGFYPQFNGRSGGYLVMHDACMENGKLKVYAKSVDDYEPSDFNDMDIITLREKTRIVQCFDKLCDELRQLYIDILSEYNIVEEEIPTTRTVKYLAPKETNDE